MKPVHKKQIWKGFFTYLAGYEILEQYKEIEFTMEITLSENSFVGTSTDSESINAFGKPAEVRGFIENDMMSFIMKYPCNYFKDEDKKIILDKTSEHPDIHYLGFFDSSKKEVSGSWEMTISEEKYIGGYLEETLNGKFEMRKIN